MQYIDAPTLSTVPTLVLVHGSWHDGSCWSPVQEQLAEAGVRSIAPTLPGHGAGDDRLGVRHGGLAYYSAFVPRDGECVADSLPAQLIEFLDQAAAASDDRTITLPDELLEQAFANTADEYTLARIRALLVPEPHAPIFETLSLPSFTRLGIPTAYITCRDDLSLPPGVFHPGQSNRLHEPEMIEIDGDHECLLTAPERLADALLEALVGIHAAHRPLRNARARRAGL